MSTQKPHPATAKVAELLQPIRDSEIAVAQAEAFLAALEMRAGQAVVSIGIAGRSVELTRLSTSYMPERVPGRDALRAAVIAEQRDHLISLRSRLEGLRHRLVLAAKAV